MDDESTRLLLAFFEDDLDSFERVKLLLYERAITVALIREWECGADKDAPKAE